VSKEEEKHKSKKAEPFAGIQAPIFSSPGKEEGELKGNDKERKEQKNEQRRAESVLASILQSDNPRQHNKQTECTKRRNGTM
jgi:hypothetical protein